MRIWEDNMGMGVGYLTTAEDKENGVVHGPNNRRISYRGNYENGRHVRGTKDSRAEIDLAGLIKDLILIREISV
ncbi:hypothetical protein TNCV_4129381 [Trichonephila clavipes]|nr:hypothetical protein TNCV_4129381 [Trichonephila clavipes]